MMLHHDWLPILMQGSPSEIYVVDATSLHFVAANPAARRNLQYTLAELSRLSPVDLIDNLGRTQLEALLLPLRSAHRRQASLETTHTRKDGSIYPIELRLFHCASEPPVYIAIGNDISARHASARALQESEARLRTIVSNTPGLIFQCLRKADGRITFPYLGDGCHALLGVNAERLRRAPSLLQKLILPDDRQSWRTSMDQSAATMKAWNWEGRIRIEQWEDIKWINIRSTPRALPDGSVQWEGIMTNITQGKLEQAEIARAHARLAELSAHVESAKEKERTRIARELHDDLGGNLTAIKMALALMKKRQPDDPALLDKTDYVVSLVDRTIEAVHRITVDLRPGILDCGIVDAIDWQAREFKKQFGITCEFSSNRKEIDLDTDQATALFRIFQEALTNIGKHAGASHVRVRLLRDEQGVRLEIADDGRGIEAHDRTKPHSFGIRGMTERAAALGGVLTVTPRKTGGTEVLLTLPLTATKQHPHETE